MLSKYSLGAIVMATVLCAAFSGALAQDAKKYPNWEGQWARGSRVGIWDPGKPPGLGQQAPLTPEYQAVLEANLKKQTEGKDCDPKGNCVPPGMPRMMMIYQPMEIIIKPNVTYFLVESTSPIRRVYTDRREWPKTLLPAFAGYSIGQWLDEDGDGVYDALTIETRGISGPPDRRAHSSAPGRFDGCQGAAYPRQVQSGYSQERNYDHRQRAHPSLDRDAAISSGE